MLQSIRLALLALLFASPSGPAATQDADVPVHGREYLRGLPGIVVSIIGSSDDALADAHFNNTLRADTELGLRQWGIRILEKGDATLAMVWGVGSLEGDSRAYFVDLAVAQRMRAIATGRVWSLTTYTTGREWRKVGSRQCDQATPVCAEGVRALVKDRVDTFIADWMRVNPSKRP